MLGGEPPEGFNYELFLDEHGEKISKSKGNGLTIEEWLTYGPPESLAFYIYREPKKAKSAALGGDPARRSTNIGSSSRAYAGQPIEQQLGNPVHHVHDGAAAGGRSPVSFGLLLNLVGVLRRATHRTRSGAISAAICPTPTPPRIRRSTG